MLATLKRIISGSTGAIANSDVSCLRRFDAAGGGRRATGFGFFGRTQAEVSGAAATVRSRARYLASNNPFVSQAVANWVGALVGTGIVPAAEASAVAAFNAWADDADADGRGDFWSLQADIARSLVVDGEGFVQLMTTDAGIRLRLIPVELVDEAMTRDLPGGGSIVQGVEFNEAGERTGYWIMPGRPTDQFASYAPAVRVPGEDIVHVMKPIGIGQVRGISWLAPIVVPANEFDATVDALAVGIKIAALHAAFLIDQNGTGEPFEPTDDLSSVSLEPGTVRRLPAGFDIKFSSPAQANEVGAFLRFNLQMLAAGLGLPEHLMSGDLTGANYSSLRAGLLPFRQRVEQLQYGTLVPQLLKPIWRRVQLLEGEPSARAEWLPPKPTQVDPLKDTEATIAEIQAGLTSRSKAVAERGWSVADLDAEIARDRAREKQLGLAFAAPQPKPGAPA